MNFGTLLKVVDTVLAVRESRKPAQPTTSEEEAQPPATGFADQIETRLTNVVVAALKEAFDRDHARLELERSHLEEQRRRAEETARRQLRQQAVDREISRLRLLAGAALVGWIASVALFVLRLDASSMPSRVVIVAGWFLLLGALASAFSAQSDVTSEAENDSLSVRKASTGNLALWLLVAGLLSSAVSLLI